MKYNVVKAPNMSIIYGIPDSFLANNFSKTVPYLEHKIQSR